MATVPTLTVGGTDQTDFIHRKTLVMKLHSLDFTLVDPADDPELHDTVSVDVPDWHGRVSTIESYPMRAADGTDHRWVKVTCTNKTTADPDTAPFGISDDPDGVTTFPYKDFGYVQTLADQTDLSTAEHRALATIYEEGLVPGMTLEVTNDAEGLAAQEFIVTDVTVEWLRDDVPTYQLHMSVEGDDPIDLGDLISSSGCDCAPYECTPADYYLTSVPVPQLSCIISYGSVSGDRVCISNVDRSPPQEVYLYAGATYKVRYSVYHGPLSWHLFAKMKHATGYEFEWDAGGWHDDLSNDAQPLSGWLEATITDEDYYAAYLEDFPRSGRNGVDSEIFAEVVWVSGPDPRFEDLPVCDESPHTGQLVLDGGFVGDGETTDYTTLWPYGANTLTVDVNGLDWTAQITETDPDAGDWGLAYPPPFGATVTPRYRGA